MLFPTFYIIVFEKCSAGSFTVGGMGTIKVVVLEALPLAVWEQLKKDCEKKEAGIVVSLKIRRKEGLRHSRSQQMEGNFNLLRKTIHKSNWQVRTS